MAAANEAEAHGAVDRGRARHGGDEAAAGVGQVGILHALRRAGSEADHAVLRLEEHVDVLGQIIRDQARQSDAEVDQHLRLHLLGDAARDDFLAVHQKALSSKWVTSTPGVLTLSGGMTPTGTIVCGSAMTTSPASAMIGLKLWAVSEYSRLP
jgi:hypothetical protein